MLTTLAHFAMSWRMTAANASGVEPTGSAPSLENRFATWGACIAVAVWVLNRATMSFGVPAGATRM